MGEVSIVGLDLAKHVFQAHGNDPSGRMVFTRKLSRSQVLPFFGKLAPCTVAMESCSASHYWAREIAKLGHDVRLVPPQYVKPFVKRQKNDAADAEAICEAAVRPSMRFVTPKTEDKHADAMLFRGRDLLVRQKVQLLHAIRGHFAEFGIIAPAGKGSIARFRAHIEDHLVAIPEHARDVLRLLMKALDETSEKADLLSKEIERRAKADEATRRMTTIPGIGPVTAMAISALAPPAEAFASGRDFAAWIGLTPSQNSSGGKERLGKISKRGNPTLRRLLVTCAATRIKYQALKKGPIDPWLQGLLARKPRMLVITALANKLARIVWAVLRYGTVFKAPAVA